MQKLIKNKDDEKGWWIWLEIKMTKNEPDAEWRRQEERKKQGCVQSAEMTKMMYFRLFEPVCLNRLPPYRAKFSRTEGLTSVARTQQDGDSGAVVFCGTHPPDATRHSCVMKAACPTCQTVSTVPQIMPFMLFANINTSESELLMSPSSGAGEYAWDMVKSKNRTCTRNGHTIGRLFTGLLASAFPAF